jgi:2-methylisocitrate lyase-like PEP mutase family enzyme
MTADAPADPAPSLAERRRTFRALHEDGCFVMPNPRDVGTAVYLAHLGFPALATSSSAMAFALGAPDGKGAVPLDVVLDHIAAVVAATGLPVNADFEGGYAVEPGEVGANVARCVGTGVAGLSIEDSTGDGAAPLHELGLAVERVAAARAALDAAGGDVLLTARAECFLTGHPDPLAEAVRRLQAYAEVGADVLYAPGVRDPQAIATLVDAAGGLPLNVLASAGGPTVPELEALGVRRVSVGSGLDRAAWGAFDRAARALLAGDVTPLADALPFATLDTLFTTRRT